jgi:hypothetical protein
MANTKGTAQNAKMIEIQMKAVAAYLEEAKKAVRIAMDTIGTGEADDVSQKMDEVLVMQRMLSLGLYDANRIAGRWTETRMARENQ